MEERNSVRLSHKQWRRIAKRERRKRLRRKAAQERDADADRLRAALERNTDYLNWLEQQERAEKEKEAREQEEHAEQERLWLAEEVRAQKEWQVLQELKAKAKQQQLEQQMKIREEFEAKQEENRKKQEEKKRKYEEQIQKQEQLQKQINDYIDNGVKTPEALREVIDSQPSKDLCPFYMKTGACRYGDACSKNHRKVFLSKVILIPGFYSHFSLEKNSAEYDTDVALEFESSETRRHFREFYKDVVTELESFGKIKTLRCCCNSETHLRGNLYVEYYTEREAARAWRRLKGRWYGGKQLNCEFTNLTSWKSAICGMTKCPKGKACNFLHTFRNPHDEYGIKSPPRWAKSTPQDSNHSKRSEHKNKSKWEETDRTDNEENRHWRWSESPEMELDRTSINSDKKRSASIERGRTQKSSRDKGYERSERSNVRSSRSSKNAISPEEKYHRSKRRKNIDKDQIMDTETNDYSSKKHRKRSRKRSDNENGHEETRRKH